MLWPTRPIFGHRPRAFGWHWVGFYQVVGDELVLGPFQGPVACTRLQRGRGVCAAAWERNEAVLVPMWRPFRGTLPAVR